MRDVQFGPGLLAMTLSVAAAACGTKTPAPAAGPSTSQPVSASDARDVDAAPAVVAAVPIDAAVPPPDAAPPVVLAPLGDVPALYALLLTKSKVFEYRWKWRIDPHDADGRMPGWTTIKLSCEVGAVRTLEVQAATVARLAAFTCVYLSGDPGGEGFRPDLPSHWLVTADGLRRSAGPEDLDALREEVRATPIILAATPVATSTKTPSSGADESPFTEWHKVFKRGKGWCSESGSTETYGSLDRACFEAKRGLVELTLAGREGPSEETYTLTRVR